MRRTRAFAALAAAVALLAVAAPALVLLWRRWIVDHRRFNRVLSAMATDLTALCGVAPDTRCAAAPGMTSPTGLALVSDGQDDDCDGVAEPVCKNLFQSYQCLCPPGYEWNSTARRCVDVNECTRPSLVAICGPNGKCINTPGSYMCICSGSNIPVDQGYCPPDTCRDKPCRANEVCIQSTDGTGPKCVCRLGFVNDNNTPAFVRDIGFLQCVPNWCGSTICGRNEICVLGPNGPSCRCRPGFVKDVITGVCTRNECMLISCKPNMFCVMANGDPKCICRKPYITDRWGNCVCPVTYPTGTVVSPLDPPAGNTLCIGGTCKEDCGTVTCVCPRDGPNGPLVWDPRLQRCVPDRCPDKKCKCDQNCYMIGGVPTCRCKDSKKVIDAGHGYCVFNRCPSMDCKQCYMWMGMPKCGCPPGQRCIMINATTTACLPRICPWDSVLDSTDVCVPDLCRLTRCRSTEVCVQEGGLTRCVCPPERPIRNAAGDCVETDMCNGDTCPEDQKCVMVGKEATCQLVCPAGTAIDTAGTTCQKLSVCTSWTGTNAEVCFKATDSACAIETRMTSVVGAATGSLVAIPFPICWKCKPGYFCPNYWWCKCPAGYVRNTAGVCVIDQCQPKWCANGPGGNWVCAMSGNFPMCIMCPAGYVRDVNGKCSVNLCPGYPCPRFAPCRMNCGKPFCQWLIATPVDLTSADFSTARRMLPELLAGGSMDNQI
ncbi:hypothetical protein HYH03_007184 [Edaphochlamys debaryana]|uniref:EGF-like domain-containing protein n=1 Tax=Edaphochlamys debaryana TaxID=47281 RepID=A0A836C0M9_9CHLO|nr:hypothetical protein HYH03_007184 [Edaphochlamys debaryana]|eukprot:KAG2494668.1 hypothetical protein HYH03_007184 [Edaphochlamys debaryana]